MTTQLDFSIVSNNTDTPSIYCYDKNDQPVDVSSLIVKWELFDQNGSVRVTKTTGAGQIAKTVDPDRTMNPSGITNGLAISILAVDTITLPQGNYPHEAVTTDLAGNIVTITNNDPVLGWGVCFIRKQLTVP